MDPDKAGDGETFIRIKALEPFQDYQFSLWPFRESWRTFWFLMNLEMVADRREHLLEASVKFLSRLDIRNPVKTPPIL